MPFETAMIAGVPAVLNLAVKSAQTGFEVSQAPQETDELFRNIASIRKDILTAKRNHKQLAHACDSNYLEEWDRSIRETESALAGLEKLVEPSRVDVQVNGKVSFKTNLMWVVRDSKSLNATNHRLTLAHNRMIMAPIRPGMRQDQQQSNPYIATFNDDPPPPYIPHQEATKRAIAERRKEEKERRHSSTPMGASYHQPPPSNPVPTVPEAYSPHRQSPPPRDWPTSSSGDLPSNTRRGNGGPDRYHSRSRTVSSPANVPTLQSSSPSVTRDPIPRSTYPTRSTLTLISPNPQTSRAPPTLPPLDEDLNIRRTMSQPDPSDYAYSPASLGEHLAKREHNALMSAPVRKRSDEYPWMSYNPPMSETMNSSADMYNSPISPSPTSPTRKPVATDIGNYNPATGRQLRVPQKLAARPPLPEIQPPRQVPDSFPSYSVWEPTYEPQPRPRQQPQQSQPKPQQQIFRTPYPPSIAPEPESELFYAPPRAQPKPQPQSQPQAQAQAQSRPQTRPPYPPSIAPEPENSNPFSTPASTSPSQTPPPTTAPKSAPNRMPTRKAVPQRRPPYPSSIVEGVEGHAYSAPAAIPTSTSTSAIQQTYPQTQRQPPQASLNPYSAPPQHQNPYAQPQQPRQQNPLQPSTNPYRRTRTTPTSPLTSPASNPNSNPYAVTNPTITKPTTSPGASARWRADPQNNAQGQGQASGDIPLPSGRWTSEREEWEDWDESDEERKKGKGKSDDGGHGDGSGVGGSGDGHGGMPYPDFPEAGYMAYRPGRP